VRVIHFQISVLILDKSLIISEYINLKSSKFKSKFNSFPGVGLGFYF